MIVVDASALIEVLLGTSAASRLAGRLFAEGETLHAPHLIDAAYLALAEALAAPLVTRDAKLASVAGHQAQIELM